MYRTPVKALKVAQRPLCPCSLCSGTSPLTNQSYSCSRAFALALPMASNFFALHICLTSLDPSSCSSNVTFSMKHPQTNLVKIVTPRLAFPLLFPGFLLKCFPPFLRRYTLPLYDAIFVRLSKARSCICLVPCCVLSTHHTA